MVDQTIPSEARSLKEICSMNPCASSLFNREARAPGCSVLWVCVRSVSVKLL